MNWFLFVLNAVVNVVNAAAGPSGPIACLTAVPAFAASRKARPAPVSKRFMLKDRFLRALRGFLLATMDCLIPGAVFKLVQWLHFCGSKTIAIRTIKERGCCW